MKQLLYSLLALSIWTPIARFLLPAISRELTRSMAFNFWFIVSWDRTVGRVLRHPVWWGEWKITWHTDSTNFAEENDEICQLYRCFGNIAIEGIGITPAGSLRYRFIGKLSGEEFITGTWYDPDEQPGGYYGAFQIRRVINSSQAIGKWVGFSKTSPIINAGDLSLIQISRY